ncbi:MAG: DnaJ C-terminal domain-containing protein, partial [Dehalococcoidia bacterium]
SEKEAEARFKELTRAYEVIGDPQKRHQYDSQGLAFPQMEGLADLFSSPNMRDIFAELSREFGRWGLRFDPEFISRVFGGGPVFVSTFATGRGFRRAGAVRPRRRGLLARLAYRAGRFVAQKLAPPAPGELDLYRTLSLTSQEAAQGVEKEVRYRLVGSTRRIAIKVPPGVTTATRIRCQGMGRQQGGWRGDLYLRVRIR